MLPHAYYSEVIQTCAAICGFALGIWAVWDARKDELFWRQVLTEEQELGRVSVSTQARHDISRFQTASELVKVVAQVTFLTIGLSGLFLEPPPSGHEQHGGELLGIAISRYGMTVVTALLMFNSVIRRRGRITYLKTIRRSTDGQLPPPALPHC